MSTKEIRVLTSEEWIAEGQKLFGDDQMQSKFVCPACGHVQSVQDYKDAGAPLTAAGYSCVGRWMQNSREAFGSEGGAGPCNYAGGGLFRIAPIKIGDGYYFDFARPEEKT